MNNEKQPKKTTKKAEESELQKRSRSVLAGVLITLAFTAFCIVFGILCLKYYRSGFFADNITWLIAVTVGFFVLYATLSILFLLKGNVAFFRTLVSGYLLFVFILILWFILQKTGFFRIIQSEENFREYLENTGPLMPLVYIIFQYLQVILLPVPGFVSTAAGVALFGPFKTMLCSLVGVILGSLTAFIIGRKVGYKAVSWMVGKENLDKWLKKVKGKDNFILTVMFLLPLFPDDILCFIAGLSSMSWQYFVVMIVIARTLAISATCYSVNFIPFNTWWGILIWCAMIAVVVIAFILLYKHLDEINAWFKQKFNFSKKHKKKNGEEEDGRS